MEMRIQKVVSSFLYIWCPIYVFLAKTGAFEVNEYPHFLQNLVSIDYFLCYQVFKIQKITLSE